MIKSAISQSTLKDEEKAAFEVSTNLLNQFAEKPKILFVFSSVNYDQEKLIGVIRKNTKDIPLVGCSGPAFITSQGLLTEGVIAAGLGGEDIQFHTSFGIGTDVDSYKAGKEAAQALVKNKEEISLIIMFIDGLANNAAAAIRGVQEVFGENFPIVGGAAGDDFKFKKTYQYYNDKVFTNSVILIGLAGNFKFSSGVRHGWEPVGLPMKATKSEGSKIIEIDKKPAFAVYQEYFGKQAEELKEGWLTKLSYYYPLGVKSPQGGEWLPRVVLAVTEKGEMIASAEVPEGAEIRLLLGDPEVAIKVAKETASEALERINKAMSKPKFVFAFDCLIRYKLLGERVEEEIEAIKSVFGKELPIVGFYTGGEIAPLAGLLGASCSSVYYNETMNILILGE